MDYKDRNDRRNFALWLTLIVASTLAISVVAVGAYINNAHNHDNRERVAKACINAGGAWINDQENCVGKTLSDK